MYEEKVGDNELIIIEGCASQRAGSILLRGPNEYTLDEMERAMHDAMCVVKRVLESNEVPPARHLPRDVSELVICQTESWMVAACLKDVGKDRWSKCAASCLFA